jgi:hypothetical protein
VGDEAQHVSDGSFATRAVGGSGRPRQLFSRKPTFASVVISVAKGHIQTEYRNIVGRTEADFDFRPQGSPRRRWFLTVGCKNWEPPPVPSRL